MSENKRWIEIVLCYKSKTYSIIDDLSDLIFKDADEFSPYLWEEGNYSCDCNKSLFIQRQCDPNFPEMKCGDEIKLISQKPFGFKEDYDGCR